MSSTRALLLIVIGVILAMSRPAPLAAAPVEPPEVAATSAIVVDADTGEVLYDLDGDRQLPPASLTKLFTAYLAVQEAAPDQLMTADASDLVGEASMGLVAGDTLHFETLLHGLLLPSGNDAAMTIARTLGGGSGDAFVARLNTRLADLGLTGTHLANPHGLDQDGHYSTARDIATITLLATNAEPLFARAIGATTWEADGFTLHQTNDLHVTYPGLVGGKTGVTDSAGNCLMELAERDGRRVLVVLLGSTPDAWYADAELLLDYGFATLAAPGRLPTFDHLPLAAPATAPEASVVPPASAPTTAVVLDPARPTVAHRRPAWVWPSSAVVAVFAGLVVLAQAQHARASRSRRGSRPLTRRDARPATVAAGWTEPFVIVAEPDPFPRAPLGHQSWDFDAQGYTADLPVIPRSRPVRDVRPTRRYGLSPTPSGGD